jgi:two-component system, OmpR family, phosphate regulon sensor histidine kinase PhoR
MTTQDNTNIEHQRLLSLINSMADGVVAVDKANKIALYNGAALNIFDLNKIPASNTFNALGNVIDQNNKQVDMDKVISEVKSQYTSRDLRLRYPDGSTINLYLSIAPVHLGYGRGGEQGFVVLLRDITREKSLEEERDEFISVVSHELRTPIAIAEGNIGNAEFIAEKTGDIVKIKEALKTAHEQTIFLASMINDLSTLSRAERGKLTYTPEAINLTDLMNSLIKNYTPEAVLKGLTLNQEQLGSLDTLTSAALYVREILQNFITNAIKYTESGSVIIGATHVNDAVKFWVKDTGIGISEPDQQKVFDKFFRSEDYRTRQNNGTGLGLYVTMKLARIVHAEISLKSALNKGSTFTILIPQQQPETSKTA